MFARYHANVQICENTWITDFTESLLSHLVSMISCRDPRFHCFLEIFTDSEHKLEKKKNPKAWEIKGMIVKITKGRL